MLQLLSQIGSHVWVALMLVIAPPSAPAPDAVSTSPPPTMGPVASGIVTGTLSGSTITATMWGPSGSVGTIQLTINGPQANGMTTGTSLGNSILCRGYAFGPLSGNGVVRAAARYSGPGLHYFELKWDASGAILGGWLEYP